ncbi:PaaI family thioesterase [Aquamicrobium sp.]|uniref:PaaI family thioesterase n=1 Tax=Aquamicrobium sp. TaxID=1872579 RepID=UPI00258DF7F8|nr:PaaI family thioesterase [Aquamicrobium sp.]MCK9552653.1 PaaI family thioesterase [Aquamicrobium sp.]
MQPVHRSVPSKLLKLQHELERPPYNLWLGAKAVSLDETRRTVAISLGFRAELGYHPEEDIFHGGVLAALADIAGYASVAIWSTASTPTISLNVDYLAPARGPELIARASVRRLGRSISRSDIEILANEKLVALARGSFSMQER